LLNNDGMGSGANGMFWIFALLCLCGGGIGGFGWGRKNAAAALGLDNMATEASMQRGFDNQNSMANQREILGAINSGTAQSVAATNQVFHDVVANLGDKYSELARDISGVQMAVQQSIANENQCCCGTKMQIAESTAGINAGIADSKYAAAMNTAAINATTVEQTQKILDALSANKIDALQAQVNQLQLQNATANVLRFPNSWSYNGGYFPPVNGCPCGGNI
jgi:hypothetical protein